jgi:type I restriction enzyme M protein
MANKKRQTSGKKPQATRIYFLSTEEKGKLFIEKKVKFDFYGGFDISQKRKTITSFHEAIKKQNANLNILEVSSKSQDDIGVKLSAFNLEYDNGDERYKVENIYQSSKVFEKGGAFEDLLYCSPRDAKRDERLKTSGAITCFEFNNEIWELEPKSAFYDYIYLKALYQNKDLQDEIFNYNVFTDIEFNPKKSINCQARSVAIFISLSKQGLLDKTLENKDSFMEVYKKIDFTGTMIAAEPNLFQN